MAFDDFKTKNYPNSLFSPELDARHLARLFTGDIADGFTVVPGTGLQVVLQPGNGLIRYGSAFVASARLVSLVDVFPMTVPTPDVSNPRIDLVVVYTDTSASLPGGTPTIANLDGPGITKAKIVTGTPNASPTAPTSGAILSSIGGSYPYTIVAQVLVNNGVSVIAANKITDVRVLAAPSKSLALGRVSYVDNGCVWSALTTLNGAMTGGLVYFNVGGVMVPVVVTSVATHGFTASKDTYVSVDTNGAITYTEVSNGANSPAVPTNSIWLGKVITNGTQIVASTGIVQAGVDTNGKYLYNTSPTAAPITVYTNPGTGGGTFYYKNQGGEKKLWGEFSSVTAGSTGTLTFPVGFFTTTPTVILTPGPVAGTDAVYHNLSSKSAAAFTFNLKVISGSGSMPVQVQATGF